MLVRVANDGIRAFGWVPEDHPDMHCYEARCDETMIGDAWKECRGPSLGYWSGSFAAAAKKFEDEGWRFDTRERYLCSECYAKWNSANQPISLRRAYDLAGETYAAADAARKEGREREALGAEELT